MTTARRAELRQIMQIAWSFLRADAGRAFADCLRGAWAWVRKMAKAGPTLAKRLRRSRNGFAVTVRSAAWDRSVGHPYRGAAFGAANAGISRAGR
jgi:hypothetical protein